MTLDIAAIRARADKALSKKPISEIRNEATKAWHSRPNAHDAEWAKASIFSVFTLLDSLEHARTDISALIAAIEASETERDTCSGLASQAVNDLAMAQKRITTLEQERDALKEALKPFDDFAQYLESETEGFMDEEAISCEYRGDIATAEFPDLKFGHFRAARRALEPKP